MMLTRRYTWRVEFTLQRVLVVKSAAAHASAAERYRYWSTRPVDERPRLSNSCGTYAGDIVAES